ncbi:MAG: hypothetical protein EPN38_01865 [Rhodanobacteraceae bacterium]|nr:MAG: hypothetical protein EPN38_01865 [Rhodanobacteraceae bacterium]
MCGRFTGDKSPRQWARVLGVAVDPATLAKLADLPSGPRYNVPPGTRTWIAASAPDGGIAFDEWLWAFPTSHGNRINVRSETAHRVPEYREHFDRHRCVVLATGFYEPAGEKSARNRPWYYFTPSDHAPLFLGGIIKPDGFAILTRAPVEPVASVHDRSPVMVPVGNVVSWLDPEVAGTDALEQFAPVDHDRGLQGWRVGDGAKRPGNDDATLIEPIDAGDSDGRLLP